MNLLLTMKALREYRRNLRWSGMVVLVRSRWRTLVFDPGDEYARACALTEGVFS